MCDADALATALVESAMSVSVALRTVMAGGGEGRLPILLPLLLLLLKLLLLLLAAVVVAVME